MTQFPGDGGLLLFPPDMRYVATCRGGAWERMCTEFEADAIRERDAHEKSCPAAQKVIQAEPAKSESTNLRGSGRRGGRS